MVRPMSMTTQLLYDESGATTVEYALIAIFVSIAVIVGVSALGGSLSSMFTLISGAVENALVVAGLS